MKPQRTLTVGEMAIKPPDGRTRFVPWIRLAARWLEQAGFRPGCKVIVTVVSHGHLDIKLED